MEQNTNTPNQAENQQDNALEQTNIDPGPGETYVGNQPEPEYTYNENTEPEQPTEPEPQDQQPPVEPSDPSPGKAYVSDQPEPETSANEDTPPVQAQEHDTTTVESEPVTTTAPPPAAAEQPDTDPDPGDTYIGKAGDILYNPNVIQDEQTQSTETQPTPDNLPDTGVSDPTGLTIIGGAALAAGAGITAYKRRRNRRTQ